MRLEKVIITILLICSFFIFWQGSEESFEEKKVFIEKVTDGDTIQTIEGTKIRLLGINTPEKGIFLYEDAKNFTQGLVKNKTVVLKSSETDKYGRELGHVFMEDKLINEIILEEGFGHLYYYEKDECYERLFLAEKNAKEKEKGIWKHSKNYGCLEIIEFVYLDLTEKDNEKLVLKNNCETSLSLTIKDDATHIYKETILARETFEKETQNIWNDEGDSIYIWDEEGLVLFHRYD